MTAPVTRLLPAGRFIVICGRDDDAQAWSDLIGPDRCLPIALDTAPPEARPRTLCGASDELSWQHRTIAGLDGSGWLAQLVDRFDPGHTARLILPDPLDPSATGSRSRIGRRPPVWRLFEDKTAVDGLWDAIGLPRARTVITDRPTDLQPLAALIDAGTGVVCSCQASRSGPSSGGDGIWWWRTGQPPPPIPVVPTSRVRLMPLLEGLAVRLHGLVLTDTVVPFPPMEIVTLPRPGSATFMCAGAVATLGTSPELLALTERLGVGLRDRIGYRGGFSVDGILAVDGLRPTDFNARLTSAIEAAPCHLRVQLHLANALTRDGADVQPATVEAIANQIFTPRTSHTLYGAARQIDPVAPRLVPVRWTGTTLDVAGQALPHGTLTVRPSPRGWLITAALTAAHLPTSGQMGPVGPEVFRLSDRVFGTDFGDVMPPFGTAAP